MNPSRLMTGYCLLSTYIQIHHSTVSLPFDAVQPETVPEPLNGWKEPTRYLSISRSPTQCTICLGLGASLEERASSPAHV
jgi:hypothetical protein